MRGLILASALVLPLAVQGQARAQEMTTVQPQAMPVQLQGEVPAERRIDGYRMLAITAGALGGAMVTNMVIGGVVAPVVMGGSLAAIQGMGGAFMVAHGAAVVVGGVAGGFFGDWLYR